MSVSTLRLRRENPARRAYPLEGSEETGADPGSSLAIPDGYGELGGGVVEIPVTVVILR